MDSGSPQVVHDVPSLRNAIARAVANAGGDDAAAFAPSRSGNASATVGLVPTMGALHAGHAALVRASRRENAITVVSIFVNAAQFNSAADLDAYPRTWEHDMALLTAQGANIVFAPPAGVMYPPGFASWVDVAGITEPLEGAHRPGHFRGVATVVTLLLRMVQPHRAYFGEKDWQQLLLVRRLATDLRLDVDIVGVPIVRDADGLALSSRNVRLAPPERRAALTLSAAIAAAQAGFAGGERRVATLESLLLARLAAEPAVEVEYAVVVDAHSLAPIETVERPARVLVAANVGAVRLIDNGPLG